jgi:hypothetical protein
MLCDSGPPGRPEVGHPTAGIYKSSGWCRLIGNSVDVTNPVLKKRPPVGVNFIGIRGE